MTVHAHFSSLAAAGERLRGTEGFLVESPEGELGWVEAVWVGNADEPCALAVQTTDGRHGLLLGADVLAVDHDQRWVVVPTRPELLELAPPHLTTTADGGGAGMRIAASWETTSAPLTAPARLSWDRRLRRPRRRAAAPLRRSGKERPIWQVIGLLYALLAFTVAFVITLAFVIAWLVTGAAY